MPEGNEEAALVTLPSNAVAQSDYEAAVKAIRATFQQAMGDESNDNDNDNDSVINATTRQLFQEAQASLLMNLEGIVEPIADEDFEDYVDLYHVMDDGDDDYDEDFGSSEEEDLPAPVTLNKEEIDEADLLDEQAWEEAQALRASVRTLSEQVQAVRERVLTTSFEQSASIQAATILKQAQQRPVVESPQTSSEESISSAESLQSSLQALSSLLQDSQWSELPTQLSALQDTIAVIQKESDQDRTKSQTEVAIISRSNTMDEDDVDDAALVDDLSAPDRLARFFELLE